MVRRLILWAGAATLVAAPAWTEGIVFGLGCLHRKRPLMVQRLILWVCAATLVAAPAWTEDIVCGPGLLHRKRPLVFQRLNSLGLRCDLGRSTSLD